MSDTWRELLMADHEITERVFAAAEKAFERREGPSVGFVANLRAYLVEYVDRVHNQKEERTVFAFLEEAGMPVHGGPVGVMLAEHARAKDLVGRIDELARAVSTGDRDGMAELREVFGEYAELCKNHFWKENDILYPMAARLLDEATQAGLVPALMTSQDPAAARAGLRALAATREEVHAAVERIRALTGEYRAPEGACRTWVRALVELEDLENDLGRHLALEDRLRERASAAAP